MASIAYGVDSVDRLDPVCVDVRRAAPEIGRGARRVVARKIVARQRIVWIIRAVSMIFDAERIGLVFWMVQDIDPCRGKRPPLSSSGSDSTSIFGPAFLRIRDDLERGNLENIPLRFGLFQRDTGAGKMSGKPNKSPVLSEIRAMLEQAEQLLLALLVVADVVEELVAPPSRPSTGRGHEKACVVVHCKMSETSGQKISCSTRSLSALTWVTMKPPNFWSRMSRNVL